MGKIKFNFLSDTRGLEINIRGFSDKIPLFIQ